MTAPLPVDLAARLAAVVGPDHVITDPDRLVVYESDGLTAYRVPPRAVVLDSSERPTVPYASISGRPSRADATGRL